MVAETRGLPESWDAEADLVVVGSGAAGLTTALVGALEGLSVTLLEKAEQLGGTTSVSGGGLWIPMNDHMSEVGLEDSREEALAYVRACSSGAVEDEVLVALVDHGHEMLRYLEEKGGCSFSPMGTVGGTLDYRPWLEGWKHGGRTLHSTKFDPAPLGELAGHVRKGAQSRWVIDKHMYYEGRVHAKSPEEARSFYAEHRDDEGDYWASGTALVGQLLQGCLDAGVEVIRSAPVRELCVRDGRVIGVKGERDGKPHTVSAGRGVVLATGGFGHNEELKRLWLLHPLEDTCEAESNEGDGHLMGMAVGAMTANLSDAWWFPNAGDATVGAASVPRNIGGGREDRGLPHTMIVNRAGRRFVNESINYYDFGEAFGLKATTGNVPGFLVFDSQGASKYSALAAKVPGPDAAVPDWLVVANSLDEVADRLGIDVETFLATVARFNGYARDGQDPEFGRGESEWDRAWGDPNHEPNPALGTVEEPPFYAGEIRPGALATKGGLRVNASGQVLAADPAGVKSIPGLYAAGNASSGSVPGGYPGAGATIGSAMTFGYLIAQHAAGTV